MRNISLRAFVTVSLAALTIACAGPRVAGTTMPAAEAAKIYERLTGKQQMDLSLVRVARLSVDGEPVEVTSLMPADLAGQDGGADAARTVIAFGPDKKTLAFFTRIEAGGKAHYLEREWADLEAGESFRFPVLTEDGSVTQADIMVRDLIQKPEAR